MIDEKDVLNKISAKKTKFTEEAKRIGEKR